MPTVDELTAKIDNLNADIKALAVEKDDAAAGYRKRLLKLNGKRDELHAQRVALRVVEGLDDATRQAIGTELAKGN